MFQECRHVLSSGQKCKAPALRHSDFCYYHRNQREKRDAPPPRQGARFVLPVLEDDHSLLNAINEVCAAMSNGQIKRSEATTYLSAVNVAARLIARIAQAEVDPVRALEYDNNCAELAPQMTGCDPVQDCLECPRQDVCELFEKAKGDPRAPISWKKLIAQNQKMSTRDLFSSYRVRDEAKKQRLRALHGLAVAEDAFDDPDAADYVLPPRQKPPQPETANAEISNENNDGLSIQAGCPLSPAVGDAGYDEFLGAPILAKSGSFGLPTTFAPQKRCHPERSEESAVAFCESTRAFRIGHHPPAMRNDP